MHQEHVHRGHQLRAGRWSEPGRIYLVTTVTCNRFPVFEHWSAGCACARVLHWLSENVPITNLAWVVMPDHVHWLFRLDSGVLSNVVSHFKSRAARQINAAVGRTGSIWQRGYHDHALRRDEDVRGVARYVVGNPLRAGLCERIGDYPFWNAIWLEDEPGRLIDP